MTRNEIESQVRQLVGNPDVNVVPQSELVRYIDRALNWLSVKLKYAVRTDEQSMSLTVGQSEYPLPADLGYIIFAEWNQQRLLPKSTYEWERDGIAYRSAPAARPMEFAVLSRTLILYPAPDSGSVSTDASIHYRAIFSAPTIPAGGPNGLSEMDVQLLIYQSAAEYLGTHPTDENTATLQFIQSRVADLLPDAEGRANNPQEEFFPRIRPEVTRTRSGR